LTSLRGDPREARLRSGDPNTGPGGGARLRERAFYDRQAAELSPGVPPRAPDEYDRALLAALGPVDGRRVLDLGCGRGDLTLELLRLGAEVVALDISSAMVELARDRAERFRPGAPVRFLASPVEATGLESGSFDRVVGKWVLHHVDVGRAAPELAHLLKPGGRAAFFENQGRNPLLPIARRAVWRLPGRSVVGTPDERPLGDAELEALLQAFGEVELDYPSFYFFEALSRALGHRFYRSLRALDSTVWYRVPRARPYGYHVLIRLRR
jgi:SAM-dependent methyltransferase